MAVGIPTTDKRMTRAELWAWFSSYKPGEGKKPELKRLTSKHRWYRCIPFINADRLVVGVWLGSKAEPMALYYMMRSGRHCETVNGTSWGIIRLQFVMDDPNRKDNKSFWDMRHYNDRFIFEAVSDEVRTWIDEVAAEILPWHRRCNGGDLMDLVEKIEGYSASARRATTRENRENAITGWMEGVPPLPDGFDGWLRDVVFGGLHELFYDKGEKHFGCSHCGSLITEGSVGGAWKRGATVVCPACGVEAKVIKHGSQCSDRKWERVMLIQPYRDRQGNPCAIMRHMCAVMNWETGVESVELIPKMAVVLPRGRRAWSEDCYYIVDWRDDGYRWSDTNTNNIAAAAGYLYPELSALDETVYERRGLEAAATRGWRLDYNNWMRYKTDDLRMEYLVKGSFKRLTREIAAVKTHYSPLKSVLAGTIAASDILGLDGQGVARMRQHDGGVFHLVWLRTAQLNGYKLPDAVWDWMAKNEIDPKGCTELLKSDGGNLSPEQIMNYVEKQLAGLIQGGDRWWTPYKLVQTWVDTIRMGEDLGVDHTKDINVRPRNLKERHDQLARIAADKRREIEAARREKDAAEAIRRAEGMFPAVKPICDEIRSTYEWGDGKHTVVVPQGVVDINREGDILGHCVSAYSERRKGDTYLDRIEKRESYILFLRRADAKDKPWYTMEVEPGGCIRQLRTVGDHPGTEEERAEAKAFLRKWSAIVRKRCSEAELRASEVAAVRRRENIEALKIGGNIIRGGTLKGELLWKVLENDFRELNEDVG